MSKEFDTSLDVLFGKVDELVSTKTVVGEAIVIGDVTLLPLIEVGVGVGLGGKDSGGSAGGMGARITPSAVSKLIDMAPGVVNKLNFGAVFGHKKEEKPEPEVKFEEELVVEE